CVVVMLAHPRDAATYEYPPKDVRPPHFALGRSMARGVPVAHDGSQGIARHNPLRGLTDQRRLGLANRQTVILVPEGPRAAAREFPGLGELVHLAADAPTLVVGLFPRDRA